MEKKLVEIDSEVYGDLEKVAEDNGFDSVEKFLTAFAKGFSEGCSVTLLKRSTENAA